VRYEIAFHPSAAEEVEATKRWYLDRSEDAAAQFEDELSSVVDQIAEDPNVWPERTTGVRQRPMRVFPFLIVYRIARGVIEVVAIAHGSRRPGYWRHRQSGI